MPLRYYPAVLDRAGDGGFGVVFPDLPGCTSAGRTAGDAAEQAADALRGHIAAMLADGDPLPEPTDIAAPLPDWLAGGEVVARVLVPVDLPAKPNRIVRLNVTLPEDVVQSIDRVSSNRSRFLADAARAALR